MSRAGTGGVLCKHLSQPCWLSFPPDSPAGPLCFPSVLLVPCIGPHAGLALPAPPARIPVNEDVPCTARLETEGSAACK